jgi:hypothetical protein
MTPSRVLPLVLLLAALPLGPAAAQFGGMPGLPGGPGGPPGTSPGFGPSPFGAPQPQEPPSVCRQILSYRDDVEKTGLALQGASKRKAQPDEVCKLFKAFIAAEGKMLKGLQDNSSTCGVPPDAIKNLKEQHSKANQMGQRVCEAAAQGPRQAGPSLSDALGTTPPVPDVSDKRGVGTFETLTGNPLQQQR